MDILKIFILFILLNSTLFSYDGIGQGKDRQESILLALKNIAGQITNTINSTTIIQKEATESSYLRYIKQTLHSDIAKVTFSGYDIIEERPMKYYYFVKLRVNKDKLVSIYNYRLNRSLESIDEKLKNTSSTFKQYSIVKEFNLNSLYAQMDLIFIIDRNYNAIKAYKDRLDYFISILNKSFDVNIESNNERAKSVITNILTQKGFSESSSGKIYFKVRLSPFNEYKYKNGDFSVSSNIYISIIENGKTILTKSFPLTGGQIDKYYAKQIFFEKLDKEIQKHIKDIL
jgi:hypothetical protein